MRLLYTNHSRPHSIHEMLMLHKIDADKLIMQLLRMRVMVVVSIHVSTTNEAILR